MKIDRIISGGQTGADRGGLDAAIRMGVAHGGWCPRGRLAEDGVIPSRYVLRETGTSEYEQRTEANVRDSDGTVVLTYGAPTGGSLRTVEFCAQHDKPCLQVDLEKHTEESAAEEVGSFVAALPVPGGTLNVAGSRESNAPGIHGTVCRIMRRVVGAEGGSHE